MREGFGHLEFVKLPKICYLLLLAVFLHYFINTLRVVESGSPWLRIAHMG